MLERSPISNNILRYYVPGVCRVVIIQPKATHNSTGGNTVIISPRKRLACKDDDSRSDLRLAAAKLALFGLSSASR